MSRSFLKVSILTSLHHNYEQMLPSVEWFLIFWCECHFSALLRCSVTLSLPHSFKNRVSSGVVVCLTRLKNSHSTVVFVCCFNGNQTMWIHLWEITTNARVWLKDFYILVKRQFNKKNMKVFWGVRLFTTWVYMCVFFIYIHINDSNHFKVVHKIITLLCTFHDFSVPKTCLVSTLLYNQFSPQLLVTPKGLGFKFLDGCSEWLDPFSRYSV